MRHLTLVTLTILLFASCSKDSEESSCDCTLYKQQDVVNIGEAPVWDNTTFVGLEGIDIIHNYTTNCNDNKKVIEQSQENPNQFVTMHTRKIILCGNDKPEKD